jgi:hypothetical protein
MATLTPQPLAIAIGQEVVERASVQGSAKGQQALKVCE